MQVGDGSENIGANPSDVICYPVCFSILDAKKPDRLAASKEVSPGNSQPVNLILFYRV